MRAVLQRVTRGRVTVNDSEVGRVDPAPGLVALVGVGPTDTEAEARLLAEKLAGLRIFADAQGKMNLSVRETGGGVLIISQFTLYADVRRGRRPGYTGAAAPEQAEPLIERLMAELRALALPVQGGQFGAHMAVELVNDGPVTIVLDTEMWARRE